MWKKTDLAAALMLVLVCGGLAERALAQMAEAAKLVDTDRPEVGSYRFDISINELEGGRKVNTRQYSMHVNAVEGRSGSLKIGTRIPIELKQGEIEYFDLGTKISARIQSDHHGPDGFSVRPRLAVSRPRTRAKGAIPSQCFGNLR
jgi:hypothetical protein